MPTNLASFNFSDSLDALMNNLKFLNAGEGSLVLEPSPVDLTKYADPSRQAESLKDSAYLTALEGERYD